MGSFVPGNTAGVDKRLIAIIKAAAEASPYTVKITSGKRAYNPKTGTSNHPGGWATDVAVSSDGGKTWHSQGLGNKKATPFYQDFARYARKAQTSMYPELNNIFRWGGKFGGRWARDNEHFDITPRMHGAMSLGNWDSIIAGHPVPPMDIPNVAASDVPGGPPTLRKGATDAKTGGAVTRLQQQLAAVPGGPPVAVDGKYGPQTEKAVRAVEKQYGLTQERPGRGAAGPQVQAALAGNERMRIVADTQRRFGGPLAPGGVPNFSIADPNPPGQRLQAGAGVVSIPTGTGGGVLAPLTGSLTVGGRPPDSRSPPLVHFGPDLNNPAMHGRLYPGNPVTGMVGAGVGFAQPTSAALTHDFRPPAPDQPPLFSDADYEAAAAQDDTRLGQGPAPELVRLAQEAASGGAPGGPAAVASVPARGYDTRGVSAGLSGPNWGASNAIMQQVAPRQAAAAPGGPGRTGNAPAGINNFGDIADAWRRIGSDVSDWAQRQLSGGGPPTSTATPRTAVPQGFAPIPPAMPESASPVPSGYNRWGRQISGGPVPTSLGGDLSRLGTPGERAEDVPGEAVGGFMGGGTLGRSAPEPSRPYEDYVVPGYGDRSPSSQPPPQFYPTPVPGGGFMPDPQPPARGQIWGGGRPSQQASLSGYPQFAGLDAVPPPSNLANYLQIPGTPSAQPGDVSGSGAAAQATLPGRGAAGFNVPAGTALGNLASPSLLDRYLEGVGGAPAQQIYTPSYLLGDPKNPGTGESAPFDLPRRFTDPGYRMEGKGLGLQGSLGGYPQFAGLSGGGSTDVLQGGGALEDYLQSPVVGPPAPATVVPAGTPGGPGPVPAGDPIFSAGGPYGVNTDPNRLDPGTLDTTATAGGVPYATDPMRRTAGFTNIGNGVVQTPQPPPSLGARIAKGAATFGAGALGGPAFGLLISTLGNSLMRTGSLDNAQPYRGMTTGNYAEAAPNPYGGYTTGSSYSASPYTPAGSGWHAPSFSTGSGGSLNAWRPNPNDPGHGTYIDSRGLEHPF